jgi:hypothetical protein
LNQSRISDNANWTTAPVDKTALKLDFRGLHSDEEAPNPAPQLTSPAAATVSSNGISAGKDQGLNENFEEPKQSPPAALHNILKSTVDLVTGLHAGAFPNGEQNGKNGYGEGAKEASGRRPVEQVYQEV